MRINVLVCKRRVRSNCYTALLLKRFLLPLSALLCPFCHASECIRMRQNASADLNLLRNTLVYVKCIAFRSLPFRTVHRRPLRPTAFGLPRASVDDSLWFYFFIIIFLAFPSAGYNCLLSCFFARSLANVNNNGAAEMLLERAEAQKG